VVKSHSRYYEAIHEDDEVARDFLSRYHSIPIKGSGLGIIHPGIHMLPQLYQTFNFRRAALCRMHK